MERSLISGSSGYLGRHLSERLTQVGQQVTALPRELLQEPLELANFVKCLCPDYVFHLGAYGNKYTQQEERRIMEANIIGTFNLLEAAKDLPLRAFVNTSTSSHVLECDTFYGATKASGEYLVRAFVKKYDKPVVSIRPFSVYGPGEDETKFIPTAIEAFKEGKELRLAPGTHDWIYIDDFIEGMVRVSQNAKDLKGKAVDIGTGASWSNHAVVGILREIFDTPGKITEVGSMREYDGEEWRADPTTLRSLGWQANVSLEEGLRRIVYGK